MTVRLSQPGALFRVAACGVAAVALSAEPSSNDEALGRLVRFRDKIARAVRGLPNYTCTENVTRSTLDMLSLPEPRIVLVDRVRLEVAVVKGTEMFSWPGAASFEQYRPAEMIGGSITTGEYSGILTSVFASEKAVYTTGNSDTFEDRPAIRYDYKVEAPEYTLVCGGSQAALPFHGSFWVDAAKEHLLALSVVVDEPPETFDISRVMHRIEFEPITMEGEYFSLPRVAEIIATYRNGHTEVRNRVEFSNCHRYAAESRISFGENTAPSTPADTAPANSSILPEGVKLEVVLESPLERTRVAAGDPVIARLARPLRVGSLSFPAGAKVSGRVIRSEAHFSGPAAGAEYIVFHLFQLESQAGTFAFRARLKSFDKLAGLRDYRPQQTKFVRGRELRRLYTEQWLYTARFLMSGGLDVIPAGFRMTWESAGPQE